MKGFMKRLITMALAFCMVISMTGAAALAAPAEEHVLLEGGKSSKLLDRDGNRYEVTVQVPGVENTNYNEVIIMVDASSSQFKNIEELKATILDIGKNVLNDNGNMHLTLMHFGISGANLFTATTYADLQAKLGATSYEDLERWPTATNCEASFAHIKEYVANSPNLERAYIMYTSDGETNMSEEARDWTQWRENRNWHHGSWSAEKIYENMMVLEKDGWNSELLEIMAGTPSVPTQTIFGDIVAEYNNGELDKAGLKAELLAALSEDYDNDGVSNGDEWFDLGMQMAYDAAGLTLGEAYSVGTVEKAYIAAHGMESAIHYGFAYISISAPSEDHHGGFCAFTKGQRAAAVCNALADADKVEKIWLLGMDGNGGKSCLTSWMNASAENKANNTAKVFADRANIEFIDGTTAGNINTVLVEMKALGEALGRLPYNDVTVTDYMSKWVALDLNSIKVYNGSELVWAYDEETSAYKWQVAEELRPTQEVPVKVTKVEAADYAAGGEEVEGNTSGDIYRLDWKVKDGHLGAVDSYRLVYEVTVDTEEAGFEYNTSYPSNGETFLTYTDENNDPRENEIKVPKVDVPKDEVLGDSEGPDEVLGDNDSPTTGDIASFWIVAAIVAVMGMTTYLVSRKKEA